MTIVNTARPALSRIAARENRMTNTFAPELSLSRHYTEAQRREHYDVQSHLFIVEALMTPYEQVYDEMLNTWHRRGWRMAMPSTPIGKKMQEEIRNARLVYKSQQAAELNNTVSSWWGRTKTFIKTLMRV